MNRSVAGLLATLEVARAHSRTGNYAAMLALLLPLEQQQLLDDPELACLLAWAWRNTGQSDEAREVLDWLSPSWRQRGNDSIRRMSLHMVAVLHLDQGELDQAERVWEELLQAAAEADDQRRVSRACNCLGVVADIRCQFSEAIAWYERALGASHRCGDLEGIGNALQNLALSYRQMGLLNKALDESDQAMRTFREIGNQALLGNVELTRASILIEQRELRLAEATVVRARERLAGQGVRHFESLALRLLGIICFARGEQGRAVEHLEEALRQAEAIDLPLAQAQAWEELAVVCATRQHVPQAQHAATRAREIYQRMGAVRRAQQVEERVATLTR